MGSLSVCLLLTLCHQINGDFGFAPPLQRWVIGKRLARDQDTLFSHGVSQDGDKAFLFILSAGPNSLTRQQLRLDQDQQLIEGPYYFFSFFESVSQL